LTPVLADQSSGRGIASATYFPTSGQYAGDAVRLLADHSDALTGTLGVEWALGPDTLAYAQYNRGYKAFALNAGAISANTEAAPEAINDYELGLKENLAPNLQVNLAAFYYDYRNDQLPLAAPQETAEGPDQFSQFLNIPRSVSDGIEISAIWIPLASWSMSLAYGFDHSEILTACQPFTAPLATASDHCFIDPADPYAQAIGAKPAGPATSGATLQNVRGNELPQTPENKVAFNTSYTLIFGPDALTLSGSYTWRDKSYASIFTRSQYDEAPSWSQVDVRATWSGDHDRYEVVAYAKNLFNTVGYNAAASGSYNEAPEGGSAPTYSAAYDLTPPRLFGGEIHFRF
jgi:iron complex outermembrane recepter protein